MRVPSSAARPAASRRGLIALLLAVPLALLPRPLLAHAVVVRSMPAADARVTGPDVAIALQSNSRVDRPRCRLALVAPGGAMTTLDLQADTAPQLLAAQAKGLAPGAYRLRWQVLAVDGHITRGDIPLTVVAA
ncbi:MAG: copper resistance protein CopC [Dongiaceae bacterium]